MAIIEKEISYTINVSQDLLYIIFDSYICKNFTLKQEYCDLVDARDVRSRLIAGKFASVRKTTESVERFVYFAQSDAVPLINRRSVELDEVAPGEEIKRIVQCRVYGLPDYPIEIKFEHVYFNRNFIDRFDSLMGSKQVVLYNLLQNKNETLVKNSNLGSDEIAANLRIECEYTDDGGPCAATMSAFAKIVIDMESMCLYQNISPQLPHTTLQNTIVYRKFEHERFVYEQDDESAEAVYRWSVKLDGVRGRGYFCRNFVIVFMDDMRMFSGEMASPFTMNNIVAFQCELIGEDVIYITDLLHVFKYGYNNRTQYECVLDPYDIDVASAIACINSFSERDAAYSFRSAGRAMTVKFQRFHVPPIQTLGYTSVPSDGYVIIDSNFNYIKYKYFKTVEVEYEATTNRFVKLDGPIAGAVVVSDGLELRNGAIYEAAIGPDSTTIVKARPDRLVPN